LYLNKDDEAKVKGCRIGDVEGSDLPVYALLIGQSGQICRKSFLLPSSLDPEGGGSNSFETSVTIY